MITRNEKAKGLWWRLLATLPVLAILLVANTKVTAQDASTKLSDPADDKPIAVEMGKFEIRDDNGNPIQLMDTVVYNEDGSYVQCVATDGIDPETGESCKKFKITTYNADGTPNGSIMNLRWEMDGDVVQYTAEPFSITEESLGTLLGGLSTLADAPEKDSIFQIVDQMPEFPGGVDAMTGFVASNIKYPQDAIDEGKEGRVFVSFVVEKDGWVSNVKVLKGVCKSIDEEAARVVRGMPRWKPGKKDGKPARVSFQMPISFKLDQMNNEHKTIVRTVIAEDESGEHSTKSSTATYPDNPIEGKPDENGVYQMVDEMPKFPGGEQKLMEYIAKNITYPQEARDKGIEGRVFIGMVVEKDGSVSNVKVLRGIGCGCDEEAVRVIKALPKWTPGKMKGEPVPVSYQIPINFKLAEQQPKKN